MCLAGRTRVKLDGLVDALGANSALAVECDVTSEADQRRAVAGVVEKWGRLDAVFANAGHEAKSGFEDGDPDEWRSMLLTNVLGAALTIRCALPELRQTRGHIVLAGSVAGRIVVPGSVYSCTKWAVTAMGEAARLETHGSGVRVTVMEPG